MTLTLEQRWTLIQEIADIIHDHDLTLLRSLRPEVVQDRPSAVLTAERIVEVVESHPLMLPL